MMLFFNRNLIFVGLAVLVLLLILDYYIFDIPIIFEIEPQFSAVFRFRTVVIFLCSFCLVAGIAAINNHFSNFWNNNKVLRIKWFGYHLTFNTAKLTLLFLTLSSCFFTLLFLHSPFAYSIYSYEDGFIEYTSALLSAISAFLFLYITRLIWRIKPLNRIKVFTAISFSLIFFLIALEEISWFQRILDIPLLPAFEDNQQQETNLHNFATDEVELFYYSGSFVFLILLPFIYERYPKLPIPQSLAFYIPSPIIIFIGSVFIAYNYDMWNSLFIQFSFFCTLFILLFYLFQQISNNKEYELTTIVIGLLIIQQAIYLVWGEEFKRFWEVTEYKEFYISWTFFIYSLEIFYKSKSLSS